MSMNKVSLPIVLSLVLYFHAKAAILFPISPDSSTVSDFFGPNSVLTRFYTFFDVCIDTIPIERTKFSHVINTHTTCLTISSL